MTLSWLSPNGAVGFIAQSVMNIEQYIWTVGTVFSSQTQSNITVPAGSYQIRIQNSATGAEPTDPISASFTLAAEISLYPRVFPASAPADGVTAVVLYGSDLDSSDSISKATVRLKGRRCSLHLMVRSWCLPSP